MSGRAVGFTQSTQLSAYEGLQRYVAAPDGTSVTGSPGQIESMRETEITGFGLTVTCVCFVVWQPSTVVMTTL